jgi:hypothetical protein
VARPRTQLASDAMQLAKAFQFQLIQNLEIGLSQNFWSSRSA